MCVIVIPRQVIVHTQQVPNSYTRLDGNQYLRDPQDNAPDQGSQCPDEDPTVAALPHIASSMVQE